MAPIAKTYVGGVGISGVFHQDGDMEDLHIPTTSASMSLG
jgi:hypothetical protein